mmetsp:Transcript_1403/g.5662  ORF Transcript_1403/g.5662 Transcript_1403/m.5662 type:complete len:213 (-) Transcript_1403:3-641(-)
MGEKAMGWPLGLFNSPERERLNLKNSKQGLGNLASSSDDGEAGLRHGASVIMGEKATGWPLGLLSSPERECLNLKKSKQGLGSNESSSDDGEAGLGHGTGVIMGERATGWPLGLLSSPESARRNVAKSKKGSGSNASSGVEGMAVLAHDMGVIVGVKAWGVPLGLLKWNSRAEQASASTTIVGMTTTSSCFPQHASSTDGPLGKWHSRFKMA